MTHSPDQPVTPAGTGTLARWLQLREAADSVSRSGSLTSIIADALARFEPIRVLDLATGTGSNLRYLAPRLPGSQQWLVVDQDTEALALLPDLTASWGSAHELDVRTEASRCVVRGAGREWQVETRRLDLERLTGANIFDGRHLVTASALLDLVSERWLGELAARCRSAGAAALFTITYNGESRCAPAEAEDDLVRELLNGHQHRDKGLGGPAAGPDAARCAVECFAAAGYRVHTARSDWSLGPSEAAMQRCLIEGWAEAAADMGLDATAIASWRARRIAHVETGRSRITVGHVDIAAVPSP